MILRRISKVILNMDIFATVRLFYEKIMKFRSDIPCRGIYTENRFSHVGSRSCLISAEVPFIDRV